MSLPLRNWETVIPYHVYLHKKRQIIRIYDYMSPSGSRPTYIEFNLKPKDDDDKKVRLTSEGREQGQISFFQFWMKMLKEFKKWNDES